MQTLMQMRMQTMCWPTAKHAIAVVVDTVCTVFHCLIVSVVHRSQCIHDCRDTVSKVRSSNNSMQHEHRRTHAHLRQESFGKIEKGTGQQGISARGPPRILSVKLETARCELDRCHPPIDGLANFFFGKWRNEW